MRPLNVLFTRSEYSGYSKSFGKLRFAKESSLAAQYLQQASDSQQLFEFLDLD